MSKFVERNEHIKDNDAYGNYLNTKKRKGYEELKRELGKKDNSVNNDEEDDGADASSFEFSFGFENKDINIQHINTGMKIMPTDANTSLLLAALSSSSSSSSSLFKHKEEERL